MAIITLESLLWMVNGGGWSVRGGFLAKDKTHDRPIDEATMKDGVAFFHSSRVVALKDDRLCIQVVGSAEQPRRIVVEGPLLIMIQRKKADGGGNHEVEQIGTLLILVHGEAEAKHKAEEAAARRQRLAEAEKRENAEAKVCQEREQLRQATFVNNQKDLIGDARCENIVFGDLGVRIEFSNGHFINFQVVGDELHGVSLEIADGKERVTL